MSTIFGFNDLYWILPLVAALFSAFFIVHRFPRISTYVFGPVVFAAALGFFLVYRDAFFFFQSEGSAAGLVVPLIMWALLLSLVAVGFEVIRGGLGRMDELKRGEDAADLSTGGYLRAVLIVMAAIVLVYAAISSVEIATGRFGEFLASRCNEDAREVTYARSLSQERLNRLFDDVVRREDAAPCSGPDCQKWVGARSKRVRDFTEFADVQATTMWANPPGQTHIRLKACGQRHVDLVIFTARSETPRIELWWGSFGHGPESGKQILWKK